MTPSTIVPRDSRAESRALGDDNVAVFLRPTHSSLAALDSTEQEQALGRLIELLESPAPQHHVEKPFQGCEELQQVRAGDYLRWCVHLERSLRGYNVLFVFDVVRHDYSNLEAYDERAQARCWT